MSILIRTEMPHWPTRGGRDEYHGENYDFSAVKLTFFFRTYIFRSLGIPPDQPSSTTPSTGMTFKNRKSKAKGWQPVALRLRPQTARMAALEGSRNDMRRKTILSMLVRGD